MSAQPNPSLQEKNSRTRIGGAMPVPAGNEREKLSPAQAVILLKKQLANNRDEQKLQVGSPIEPNYKLVEMLLGGVEEWAPKIDSRLQEVLSEQWKRERMSPLLVAILQCGIFEMFFAKEISAKIVIDEYTRLTRSFFSEAEVNFVHAALSKLARKYSDTLADKDE